MYKESLGDEDDRKVSWFLSSASSGPVCAFHPGQAAILHAQLMEEGTPQNKPSEYLQHFGGFQNFPSYLDVTCPQLL